MAGGEHQAQEIIADRIVDGVLEFEHGGFLARFQLVGQFLCLRSSSLPRRQRSMARAWRFASARPRVDRNAGLRPFLQRGDERVLRQLFGQPYILYEPRETGDDFGGFDPPNRLDGAMNLRLLRFCPSWLRFP